MTGRLVTIERLVAGGKSYNGDTRRRVCVLCVEITEDLSKSQLGNADLADTPLSRARGPLKHRALDWMSWCHHYTLASGLMRRDAWAQVCSKYCSTSRHRRRGAHAHAARNRLSSRVLCRRLGTTGANIPAVLRALVMCGGSESAWKAPCA